MTINSKFLGTYLFLLSKIFRVNTGYGMVQIEDDHSLDGGVMGRGAELLNAALTVIIKYWVKVDIISLLF